MKETQQNGTEPSHVMSVHVGMNKSPPLVAVTVGARIVYVNVVFGGHVYKLIHFFFPKSPTHARLKKCTA